MRVEEVVLSNGKTRYMLVNSKGQQVEIVLRFLRYKDLTNSARNTLRAYCFHLKLFFEFLEQESIDFQQVNIDDMARFMSWLKNPYGDNKVVPLMAQPQSRKPRTINTILNTVTSFYDYLMRHEEFSSNLSKNLKTQISGSKRGFRDFLYHINKSKIYKANVFKVKVPKSRPKTLKRDDVIKIIDACSNLRDRLLIQLLWESGIRIGEALSLWLEDFEIDSKRIVIYNRGELANGASIKTIGSERKVDVSDDLMNLYFEYIAEFHDDEVDTNHVFIKLSGKDKNQPLDYDSTIALFKRIQERTGIYITPHMLRHTSLNELRKAGWKNEHLMKRAGHKNIQTTMNFYMHVDDDELREEWKKTEENIKLNKSKERTDD